MTHLSDRRRRGAVLLVMCVALMTVVAAVASLNVALPSIALETGASQQQLQWIVDAYAMVFAGLLLPAGAIGDRYGRRGTLVVGLTVFGGAAAGAAMVDVPSLLIALRGLMGVGAALIMPVTLSVITTVFPPEERGRAVGTWVGVASSGAVVGLLGAGLLLEWFSWSAVFALNAALAGAALAGTLAVVPATRDAHASPLDPVGALLSMAGVAGLVYAVIEAPTRGWGDAMTTGGLVASVALLAAFLIWEARREDPMLDPRLFRRRGFASGSLSITVQFFAGFGFFFIALQYLQLVAGHSPLTAALALAPMAAVAIPLARLSPSLADRLGVRVVGAAGLVSMAIAFLIWSTLDAASGYGHFLAGLLPLAAGMALAGAPATTAITASLPAERQGVASAVNDTARELGGALGIAVLGSVLYDRYRSEITEALGGLSPDVAVRAQESLAFVTGMAEGGDPRAVRLLEAAQASFMDGLTVALLAGAAVLLAGAAVLAARGLGRGALAGEDVGRVAAVGSASR